MSKIKILPATGQLFSTLATAESRLEDGWDESLLRGYPGRAVIGVDDARNWVGHSLYRESKGRIQVDRVIQGKPDFISAVGHFFTTRVKRVGWTVPADSHNLIKVFRELGYEVLEPEDDIEPVDRLKRQAKLPMKGDVRLIYNVDQPKIVVKHG